jgi:hypothetical protein
MTCPEVVCQGFFASFSPFLDDFAKLEINDDPRRCNAAR